MNKRDSAKLMNKTIHIWNNDKPFNDYTSYFKKKFNVRIQKLSVNTGLTCPNRDGTIGIGGCIYCDNNTFNPEYCEPAKYLARQIKRGLASLFKNIKSSCI